MDPRTTYTLISGAIMVLAGVYGTLLGRRVVGKKPGEDAEYDRKFEKRLKWLKWGGPLIIVLGVIITAIKLAGS